MDFVEIFKENQSKVTQQRIIKYIGSDKIRFKELALVFLKGDSRSSQCAGWPLSEICILHPELINPYFDRFIKKLMIKSQHPAVYRNLLRVFMHIEIPKKYHGVLIDFSFKFIRDIKFPHGIRAFAIRLATNICKNYPDVAREFVLVLDELNKYPQPPSIKCCIRDAFKIFKR